MEVVYFTPPQHISISMQTLPQEIMYLRWIIVKIHLVLLTHFKSVHALTIFYSNMLAQLYNPEVVSQQNMTSLKRFYKFEQLFWPAKSNHCNFSVMYASVYSSILNNYILNLITLIIALMCIYLNHSIFYY